VLEGNGERSHEKGWAGGGKMRWWKKFLAISDHKNKGIKPLRGNYGCHSSDITPTLGNGSSRI